jgi:hypothetical protein
MTAIFATAAPIASVRSTTVQPAILRAAMLTLLAAVVIAGFLATGSEAANLAITRDGADLTRLMRFLAAIKGIMAIAAAVAVLWRLGAAISLPWFAAYAVACAAMAAGPGLIWTMSHVALGAFLLHTGLFATIILMWNDPAVSTRLAARVAARRQQIATRTG